MTIARSVLRFSAIGTLALSLSGAALADDATLSGPTGSDSTNTVVIDNHSSSDVTNTNDTQIENVSVQVSTTGNVTADENTSIGGSVGSGNASNSNATTTTVTNDNTGSCTCTTGGGSGGDGNGGGGQGGSGGSTGGGSGGSVLGASTGGSGAGGAVLPEVGASVPVDVSALRALYHAPVAAIATPALVKDASGFSPLLLALAALLSLLGALGTSLYNNRRERLVN